MSDKMVVIVCPTCGFSYKQFPHIDSWCNKTGACRRSNKPMEAKK